MLVNNENACQIKKVVTEKKWREVGGVFRFSATTTSASFVLRKHYLNLLFHYEQVHLFNARGPLLHPTGLYSHFIICLLGIIIYQKLFLYAFHSTA